MASVTKNYTVEGMTCAHCKASVEEEVGEINGVFDVEAHVEQGRVAVSGEGFTDDDVIEAIIEAGYSVKE
ncbi:heavy-metal-associated domain-containing protein [Corynebacterium halotolerans]|uniref:Cation transport protein n=1 Tax=Corynebacterium halotolerans YIM 70093 = DSM 44683 TaxID=1121362 RepID=M1PAH2_9CORY|nr:cation transporter [Corynebacterium halotolerans]AGF73681.1 Cation transport protein [Corynebacterium halotolerans YIM 70093 = DSM 44683]